MSEGRLDDLRDWLRQQGEPPEPKWRPGLIALAVAAVAVLVGVAALLLLL